MFPSEGIRSNQARCRDHGKMIDYSRIFPGAALDEVSQDNRDETCASYDIIEVRGSGGVFMELNRGQVDTSLESFGSRS